MSGGRAYLGQGGFRWVSRLSAVVGVAAAIGGPVYAINGATKAPAAVEVTVELRPEWRAYDPFGALDQFERPDVLTPDQRERAATHVLDDGEVVLSAWNSSITEQVLARGDVALLGLVLGAAALLLVPVAGSISAGQPFRRGTARRFAILAGVVLVYGVAAPVLPAVAASSVLHRTGLSDLGVFEPDSVTFPFMPFVVVVGLLVLGEAFRRGEQLADDVEGLV